MINSESTISQEEVHQNGLIFCLNKEEHAAYLIGNDNLIVDVVIPPTIFHEDQEFNVTKIIEGSFSNSKSIQSVKLPIDSKIQIIEKDSFTNSTLESILISNSVLELNEGWCRGTPMLTKISIATKNENFIYLDNKIILGKTETKSEEYDVIVFARRDITNLPIPSFIKKIASFAFSETQIESISIPKNITQICEGAFSNCEHLQKVQFLPNSNLEIIAKDAFSNNSIECISIQSSIIEIQEDWQNETTKIEIISDDKNFDEFETIEEIPPKSEDDSVFIIEDKNTNEKYVKQIFKENFDKSKTKHINNIIKIIKLTEYPGILSVAYFTNKPFSIIINEHKSNGTLSDYITKNTFTETQKFIILFGILKAIEFLTFHNFYIVDLTTNDVYIDDNLYPQISVTELIIEDNVDSTQFSPINKFKNIAYELLTGNKTCDLSNIEIEWQKKFLETFSSFYFLSKCINNLCSIKKETIELNEDDEINKYESILKDYLLNYSKEIQENAQNNIYKRYLYAKMLNEGYIIEKNKEEAYKLFKIGSDLGHAKSSAACAGMFFSGISSEDINRYMKLAADQGDIRSMLNYSLCKYFLEKNIEEAIKYYKMAADKGSVEAMHDYADILMKENANEANKTEAVKYYKMAADKGNVSSMYSYGLARYLGEGIEINKEESAKYFKLAADKGHTNSAYNYGILLYGGKGIEINKEEAAKYFKLAADKGNADSMNNYADMLFEGDGIEKNEEEAVKYYKMAADKENLISMHSYALACLFGEGIETNKEEAAKYFKLAADKGYARSMDRYGDMLSEGIGVEANKKEAAKYYKRAAENGNIDSMFSYAIACYYGEGIKVNKKEAARYFKLAADNGGSISSFENYGLLCYKGDGIETNKEEAAKYYKLAADEGSIKSIKIYANMLLEGDGIETNKEEAAKYLKMAADNEDIDSSYIYAKMLSIGDGIKSNKEEAAKYFKIAVDKNHTYSLYNYSLMLYEGEGIETDKKAAAKYFKLAADKGNENSMFFYAKMLSEGDGIKKNKKEAENYYSMAYKRNFNKFMINHAYHLCNETEQQMNREDALKFFDYEGDKT